MKFPIDFCPICGKKLKVSTQLSFSKTNTIYLCRPKNTQIADIETTMRFSHHYHKYEVTHISDNLWTQSADIPPFAIDSDYTKNELTERYASTVYKWVHPEDRKSSDIPGWQEIADFPYISILDRESMVQRLKRLLLFL